MSAHPHDRAGTEPRNARSPLVLRLVMAVVAAVLFGLGAVALLVTAAEAAEGDRGPLLAAGFITALVALTAIADAAVVRRRLRRGDHG